jgi:hypothetical protein
MSAKINCPECPGRLLRATGADFLQCDNCGRVWVDQPDGLQADHRYGDYDWEELRDILRAEWPGTECWMTGGGIWNPVLPIERAETGEAIRYVIFSMGWCPEEASFGLMLDDGDEWGIDQGGWGCWDASEPVPMTPDGIRALVRGFLEARGLTVLPPHEADESAVTLAGEIAGGTPDPRYRR